MRAVAEREAITVDDGFDGFFEKVGTNSVLQKLQKQKRRTAEEEEEDDGRMNTVSE